MKTKRIVYIGIFVSLALVLDYIKEFIPFLNMPSGGSINIALIPVVLSSFILGPIGGITVGLLWWLVSSLLGLNPYFVTLSQYLCDYVIPSSIIGLASIFYYKKQNNFTIILGIIFAMFLRMMCQIISGAYFWVSEGAKGSVSAWTYSISYNLPYNILSCIMLIIVVPLIYKRFKRMW